MVSENYTDSALADVWYQFIKSFTAKSGDRNFVYLDELGTMARDNKSMLIIDYLHILNEIGAGRTTLEVMEKLVIEEPDKARSTLAMACVQIIKELNEDYTPVVEKNFHGEFKNITTIKEIPDINHQDVGRMIMIEGLVTEVDEKKHIYYIKRVWECNDGHHTSRYSNSETPKKCDGIDEEDNPCTHKHLIPVEQLSVKDDFVQFVVQQRPDKVKETKAAVDIEITVIGKDNVKFVLDQLKWGDYISVCGVVRISEVISRNELDKPLTDIYLDCSSIEIKPESALAEDDSDMKELVKEAIDPKNEDRDFSKIVDSVAPSVRVEKDDIIKEAVILLLLGSPARTRADGTPHRGEINGLMIGDPSIGKTTYGLWAKQVRSRGIYNSGANTSAVGLVGGIMQTPNDKKPSRIAAGAMGLAGDGICIIDELEKRPKEHFEALAEPLSDNQTVTIRKAGHGRESKIRCSTLALANPNTSTMRYDPRIDIYSNTKIPNNILQRFDWIFIIRDIADNAHDDAKFDHYISSLKTAIKNKDIAAGKIERIVSKDHYPIAFMKHYIQHARDNFNPDITKSQDVLDIMRRWYNRYRKLNIHIPKDDKERETFTKDDEIPAADLRKLGAFIRLAEASARGHFREEVTISDAKRAERIIEASIASTGFNPFTGEMGAIKQEQRDSSFSKLLRDSEQGWAKQLYHELKVFTTGLEKLSWERCQECTGGGMIVIPELNAPEPCELCDQRGGKRQPFSRDDLEMYCTGRHIALKAFSSIWSKYIKTGEIIKDGAYYINKMPHIDHYVRKMEEDLSEDSILKQSIAHTDPAIMRRLEEDES
mgnify:CR=1 FL=1